MEFIINLRDNSNDTFIIDLGAVFMFRWNGTEWIIVGEINVKTF